MLEKYPRSSYPFLLLASVYCLCELCWQMRRLCSLSPVRWWRRPNARIAWRHWTNTLTHYHSHSALEKSLQDSLMPLSSAMLELPYWSHCLRWYAHMGCYMAWDRGHCIPFPITNLPPKFELGGSWIRFWNWVCKVPDVAVYCPCKLKYVTYSIVKNVLNWLWTLVSVTYGFHWTQYHRHMYVARVN